MVTFVIMLSHRFILSLLFASLGLLPAMGQSDRPGHVNPEDREVDMDNPTFEPMLRVG